MKKRIQNKNHQVSNETNFVKELKKYLMLLVANFFLAAALIVFVNNADIMTGGLGGIAIIFGKIFPDFEYITSFVVTCTSWVLFFIGWFFKGKKFALKTLFSTITYPLFITILEYAFRTNNIFPSAVVDGVTNTGLQLIYAILAGCFVGFGLGIAFKVGGSTGGLDIPSVIIAEKFHISIDRVIFLIDAVIIIGGFFVLPFISVVIGIISNIVYTYVIDKVIVGGKKSLLVQIISDKIDEINDYVKNNLDRGSTFINVVGGYQGAEHRLLEVAVYRREYSQLINFIHSVDENAFVISLDAKEVFGKGFKQYDAESIK